MPATPDVLDDEDLDPWSGALEGGFVIEDALVSGAFEEVRAAGGRIARSRLARVGLTGARLRSLALTDVLAPGLEASGADLSGAVLRRVAFTGARLGGLQLVEATAEDVVFRDCRLELTTFRGAKLRNVRFEGCILDEADFLGGQSAGRPLRGLPPVAGRLHVRDAVTRVDLRGSDLDPVGDVAGLRGATIDSIQLAGLAPLLARAAGIKVDDD